MIALMLAMVSQKFDTTMILSPSHIDLGQDLLLNEPDPSPDAGSTGGVAGWTPGTGRNEGSTHVEQ